jgi:hypothetical protein
VILRDIFVAPARQTVETHDVFEVGHFVLVPSLDYAGSLDDLLGIQSFVVGQVGTLRLPQFDHPLAELLTVTLWEVQEDRLAIQEEYLQG